MDKIIVLDFGSQYSHLICRRIREFSVYAELVPYDISYDELQKLKPTGIIFSGGPSSVYNIDAPNPEDKIFEMNLPLLGICYGHQLIVNKFGGKVKRANKEYGSSLLTIDNDKDLLNGVSKSIRAWMSHGDEAEQIPEGFKVIGHTENAKAAAIASEEKSIYGIQFHPEVVHTEQGTEILKNFVLKVCRAKQDWTMKGFIDSAVEKISKINGNVLCGVSGGIDSTVVALLIHKAIGNRLKCVFVNNGLLRLNEEKEIEEMFKDNFKVDFTSINAVDEFLGKLKGIEDPERKRKIVGEEFIHVFSKFAETNGPFKWLAQGTLYPDVIESGVSKGPASVIKSHHNVGGLPDWLNLEILEPLRELYKDEVREIAKILGVPEKLFMRHPFPGPGLAVRIIGEVTPTKLNISKIASKIVEDELMEADLYEKVWQAYAAVGDDRAVGVVGDERRYGNIVMIRVVDSVDAMTADWTRLSHELLEKMSNRITNEIEDVTWVTYTISSKPPATIEPQ
ncbi:MAG: glutamine-hydrolyzing GMP synthase [Nitrosopumilus sp.]|nr:glutamine-hydrolyzing GMP synthase [Nitrosopumilus sp.]MDH3490127.1 glutamine-hydrolyzing GMP synthase [Nitrosopumilus sp.]MDH3517160.1 glutamine-hydrolyzing GMP synthase [Nitrosopumilus sp.]MDH3565100.1 glutamine-hydrolyzing GMP synthase [Nitrosopumilus sp.]MDH5555473.1 glutamine-hydrolyzing GMP synthase [Nitrosopumilus sp.]